MGSPHSAALFVTRDTPSWTACVPLVTGPLSLTTQVHSAGMVSPPESLTTSRPSDSRRTDSPEVLRPQNDILGLAPLGVGCPPLPRFRSQAFSTSQRFPSRPELHGPIPCRDRSWASSFRAFPSQRSCSPLEATSSPAVIHQRAGTHSPALFVDGFPDAHAQDAVARFPRPLWTPFPQAYAHFPVALSPGRHSRPLPLASPTSKPCSPCESVRTDSGYPDPAADALLDFLLSRDLLEPRSLSPPESKTRTRTFTHRIQPATPGAQDPWSQVRPPRR
jgi:hypothetical protein